MRDVLKQAPKCGQSRTTVVPVTDFRISGHNYIYHGDQITKGSIFRMEDEDQIVVGSLHTIEMPRKAAGKARAKRAIGHATSEASTSDTFAESYNLNSSDQTDMGIQAEPVQRGAVPTRGAKRRRISNNVNCSMATNEIYGRGTIIASNPFDDDFPDTSNHVSTESIMDNKLVTYISKQPPGSLHHTSHLLHPPGQHSLHPHQEHHNQHQVYQQRSQSQQYAKNPDDILSIRDVRQPMTPAPYSPYNTISQNPISRHTVPNDMANLPQPPPPPPPLDSYTQAIDTVMPAQSPYATNNFIGYCRRCQREIYQGEPSIICKASCKTYFHSSCSGLIPLAYEMLMRESSAEWACDNCTSTDWQVPYVKYKH